MTRGFSSDPFGLIGEYIRLLLTPGELDGARSVDSALSWTSPAVAVLFVLGPISGIGCARLVKGSGNR